MNQADLDYIQKNLEALQKRADARKSLKVVRERIDKYLDPFKK